MTSWPPSTTGRSIPRLGIETEAPVPAGPDEPAVVGIAATSGGVSAPVGSVTVTAGAVAGAVTGGRAPAAMAVSAGAAATGGAGAYGGARWAGGGAAATGGAVSG